MRIAVVGCGYVGLVTGACLAEIGHSVAAVDSDQEKMAILRGGGVPIAEPHLHALIRKNCREGRLEFAEDLDHVGKAVDAVFICVGTPPLPDGDADLTALDRVARKIACHFPNSTLVVEKSTTPVRTATCLVRALEVYSGSNGPAFEVACNPEFLREGSAVHDFLHPDRIVFGVQSDRANALMTEIYRPILDQNFNCPLHASHQGTKHPLLISTDMNTAELIKHASNAFLALKISYINAIADICELLGADVEQVARGLGSDPRIGHDFLRAGLGFGGFCLPKDIEAFVRIAEKAGYDFAMLRAVQAINRRRIDVFMEKVKEALWVIPEKRVGILGLSFKPNTDDIRFAPSIEIIRRLVALQASVRVYDPLAMDKVRPLFPQVEYCQDAYGLAQGCQALLLVTEWKEFEELDWAKIKSLMERPLIVDGRNMLNPAKIKGLGFEYISMGRHA
jgi:UDPglucose 6-dehydrogenase